MSSLLASNSASRCASARPSGGRTLPAIHRTQQRGACSASSQHASLRSVCVAQRQQQQAVVCKAQEGMGAPGLSQEMLDEIPTAKDAIDLGQALCRENRWGEALTVFEKALTLPGTGLKRYRDKPRVPSDGEKSAALFNIACCHSRLGDVRSGLVSLAGCFEAGYEGFQQARTDPDLEALRADERFEALMARFEPKPRQKLFGFL